MAEPTIQPMPGLTGARSLLRLPVVAHLPAVLVAVAVITPLASVDGGWSSTSWGWPSLALAWAAIVAVLVRSEVEFTRLEIVTVAVLGAFALWTAMSATWSGDAGGSILSLERLLVYVTALAAAFTVVRTRAYPNLLAGVWIATTLVCGYAVATRIFPTRFNVLIGISGNRLAAPVGYWNGLGLLAVVGILVTIAFVAWGRSRTLAALAAASLVPQSLALYFTYSRGAWGALIVGLAVALALDPRRLRYAAAVLAVGLWPALAVLEASRQSALTSARAVAAEATQGSHVARLALVWAALAALAAIVFAESSRRYSAPRSAQRGFAAALAAALVVGVIGISVAYGSPPTIVRKAWHSFAARPAPLHGNDLNSRLLSFSANGRIDLWKAAWADVRDHPVLGSGAGTYQREWLKRRTVPHQVVNAHSLYLETLAELGPVGLLLLLAALALPFVAAWRARAMPLVAGAAAAYAAFVVHAGLDWEWQLPGVALAPILCGAAVIIAARHGTGFTLRTSTRLVALALLGLVALVSVVGLVGNRAAAAAATATSKDDWAGAETQASKAARWAPWSSRPYQLLAEAELQRGDFPAARDNLGKAIAKNPQSWQLWLDLAVTSDSRAGKRAAARRALRLNPLGDEINAIRPALGLPPAKTP